MFYKIINNDLIVVKGIVLYNKNTYKENALDKLYFDSNTVYNTANVQDGFLLSAEDIKELCSKGLAKKCEGSFISMLKSETPKKEKIISLDKEIIPSKTSVVNTETDEL